jgi:hypothetical protein
VRRDSMEAESRRFQGYAQAAAPSHSGPSYALHGRSGQKWKRAPEEVASGACRAAGWPLPFPASATEEIPHVAPDVVPPLAHAVGQVAVVIAAAAAPLPLAGIAQAPPTSHVATAVAAAR